MLINDLISELKGMAVEPFDESKTADVIKIGDGSQEIKKIAVTMTATPDVIKLSAEYGANFLIVHEPLFYTHMDTEMSYAQCHEKKKMLEKAGLTVFRFHDYAHRMVPDLIYEGQIKFSGLSGYFKRGKYFAVNRFILDKAMTTLELVGALEQGLNVKHLRIVGCRDNEVRVISCCFGTPGHLIDELEECDVVLTGEICEWSVGEYVRDASQMGKQKSMVVMGHINSEKFGMELLAEKIRNTHSDIDVKYFDCGDVYSYIE